MRADVMAQGPDIWPAGPPHRVVGGAAPETCMLCGYGSDKAIHSEWYWADRGATFVTEALYVEWWRRFMEGEYVSLPEPVCTMGYTEQQQRAILGERFDDFARWMHGQTGAICDGWEWNDYSYLLTGCGPHGSVIYPHDLRNFLEGGRVVD